MEKYLLLICILPILPVFPANLNETEIEAKNEASANLLLRSRRIVKPLYIGSFNNYNQGYKIEEVHTFDKDYKIVGGSVVDESHKYPYQVYYRPGGNYICGGSIINKNHVITAAHCINAYEPHPKHYVIVGHDRVVKSDALDGPTADRIFGRSKIGVKRFIKRRDGKDIAILQLVRDIEFNDRVQPICLPGRISENYAGWRATVTGWGGTVPYAPEDDDVAQVASDHLRETSLTVLEPNSRLCKKARGNREHMLCAYEEGNDACQGDSGGPLTVRENGKFVLIGVVSGGAGCGAKGHTGTYTRATYFAQWIRDSVGYVCTAQSTGDRPQEYNPRPVVSQTEAPRPNTRPPYVPQVYNPRPIDDQQNTPRPFVPQNYNPRPIDNQQNTPRPFVPQNYNPRPISSQSNAPVIETETCSCSDFVNRNGFGMCRKRDSDFGGSFSCYVNLPSNCPDLVRSGTQPGKFLSAQACRISKPTLPLSSSAPVKPVYKPTLTRKPASDCSCSDFVNRNGFGRCKRKDTDFGGAYSCYVNLPSSCPDLIRSGSNRNKYLSAEACPEQGRTSSRLVYSRDRYSREAYKGKPLG